MFIPASFSSGTPVSPRFILSARYEITPSTSTTFARFFIAEQLIGGLLLLILLLTVRLGKVRRSVTWLNFIISFIIFSISYSLLTILGFQTGPAPPFGACLSQAIFVYGAPPLCAATTLALTIEMWLSTSYRVPSSIQLKWTSRLLVLIPYFIWLSTLLFALVLGLTTSRAFVTRLGSSEYCVIRTGTPGRLSASFVVVLTFSALVLQSLIARRMWNIGVGAKASPEGPGAGMMFRMGVFNLVSMGAIGVSIAFMQSSFSDVPSGVLGTLPVVVFCVFGTQKDVFRVWGRWLRLVKE